MLSTASDRTVVDTRLRPILGKPLGTRTNSTLDGPLEFDEFEPIPMKIGSIEFKAERPLMCNDLAVFRAIFGRDIYGLVGSDFLKGRIAQIDFDGGKFRILASLPENFPAGTDFEAIGTTEHGYAACFSIPGVGQSLYVIDTAMTTAITISTDTVDAIIKGGLATRLQQAEYFGMTGRSIRRCGRLSEFILAEWTHSDLRFLESTGNAVGLRYLARYCLTLDYREEFIYLTPGRRFEKPELDDWSQMAIASVDGNVVARAIAAGGIAEKAGVKEGDVLSKINGKATAEFSLFEIRELFSSAKPVQLVIRRDDRQFSVLLEPPTVSP